MARPTRTPDCHPQRKHAARGMCDACYARWLAQRSPKKAPRRRHVIPLSHPLFADRPLLREMQQLGFVSWDVVEKIRALRQQAHWSLKDLATLFGLTVSFVALACSHLDLNTIAIPKLESWDETNGLAYSQGRHRRTDPADGVHFGRAFSEPANDTGGYTDS